MNRVFITGMGAISPFGVGIKPLWESLISGSSAAKDIPESFSAYYDPSSDVWAPLPKFDWKAFGITRSEEIKLDPISLLSFVATSEALHNAGLNVRCTDEKNRIFQIDGIDPASLGVSMGTGLGGSASFRNYVPHLLKRVKGELDSLNASHDNKTLEALVKNLVETPRVNPYVICQTMPNALSANLAIRFGAKGMAEVSCYACAASTYAIHKAVSSIKLGDIELAICGGAEHFGDSAGGIFMGFDTLKTLAKSIDNPSDAARPFDKNRNGFLFSEGGAGILILESERSLAARGGTPVAEILGTSTSNDATSIVAIDPDNNQIGSMLDKLMNSTNSNPADVTYINAHGTGTLANDSAEARVLSQKFPHQPIVNSTKGALGHSIGACGAIELIVTTLSLTQGRTHSNANLQEPDCELNLPTKECNVLAGLGITQNMGFGGHNAAILVKS